MDISNKAKVIIDKDYIIGEVDKRLYGSFIEHLGKTVYEGIYEPDHPMADENGFRKDVIEEIKKLKLPLIRYPGGNFVSGYDWKDGIGPKNKRPNRLELAWFQLETNEVGLNEYMSFAQKAGVDTAMAVNLGTEGPKSARDLIDYCNHPSGTYFSDLRRSHGREKPYNIKTWCLGNEMDTDVQIGHKTAYEYGRVACETAKIMKWIDPSIELVACGSSSHGIDTYPAWDMTVLEEAYEHIDYMSLHTYIWKGKSPWRQDANLPEVNDSTENYLAKYKSMDKYIKTIIYACDYMKEKKKIDKTINISFDEWGSIDTSMPRKNKGDLPKWISPRAHDTKEGQNFESALVFGSMILTLMNNADRVKIGCLTFIVNGGSPIMTVKGKGIWKQITYYPFMHASLFGRGTVLNPIVNSPKYDSIDYTDVNKLQTAVIYNKEKSELTIFAINKDLKENLLVNLDIRGFSELEIIEHIVLKSDDINKRNTVNINNNLEPVIIEDTVEIDGNKISILLNKLSWNVIRFKCK